MNATTSLTVGLRGYPEAVLASDTLKLDIPASATAATLVQQVARQSGRLGDALLHPTGAPRATTKVLVGGVPVGAETALTPHSTVTILASLPCDG